MNRLSTRLFALSMLCSSLGVACAADENDESAQMEAPSGSTSGSTSGAASASTTSGGGTTGGDATSGNETSSSSSDGSGGESTSESEGTTSGETSGSSSGGGNSGGGATGLAGYCDRYFECGGSYYADTEACIDASVSFWGDCPEMLTALDAFGDCMIAIDCNDYNPDAYDPNSTVCAEQWGALYDVSC